MTRTLTVSLTLILLVGCSSSPQVVAPATTEQRAMLLDKVKTLAGTWEASKPMDPGHGPGMVVFTVTSNGSAVREVMFPTGELVMTNMYTMDGPTLLVTHYCSIGNQPHMRACTGTPNRIEFKSDGVSNLTSAEGKYMGGLTIVFKDANTIEERWTMYDNGKPQDEHVMEFKRKKS